MILHIYIDGRERFCENVEPGKLDEVLVALNLGMQEVTKHGHRFVACLDSDRHANVTYLLGPKNG